MFYSHEILTSRQYGVATIWLVATIGAKSSTRKVTRKAIQAVDVQKACGKILEPGAPIALRLQGNLLYGVSRVFSQQCNYMLTDTEKVQAHMRAFVREFGVNLVDPSAGKARRDQLILDDDPDFVPNLQLPVFSLDMALPSQNSGESASQSQMSPLDKFVLSSSQRSSSSGRSPFLQLDLPHSDSPLRATQLSFDAQSLPSAEKAAASGGVMYGQEAEEEVGFADDILFQVDGDGNIVELPEPRVVDEDDPFALPLLPGSIGDQVQEGSGIHKPVSAQLDNEADIIMAGEELLSEAEAFPERGRPLAGAPTPFVEDERRPARRGKKARRIQADTETQITRLELKDWQDDYLKNCTTQKAKTVSVGQATRNAMLLSFSLGIGNVGQQLSSNGIVSPLAELFSGDALFKVLTGIEIHPEGPRGQRRSASEAFDDEEDERRVRSRTGTKGDDALIMPEQAQQSLPELEVGREAGSVLDDPPSSAMPWNRDAYLPSSSVRGPNTNQATVQQGHEYPSSPLKGRGNQDDIMRYSDDAQMCGTGDDFDIDIPPSYDGSFDDIPSRDTPGKKPIASSQALDLETQRFARFIQNSIEEHGERREDEDFALQRKWISFEDILVPQETTKAVAANAFYHILGLKTKDQISVNQEGSPNKPFGNIWIGLKGDQSPV